MRNQKHTISYVMENGAVSFLTCTHTWRLLPRSEELAHGLDRAPKRLPLPSHPFQQVDRRCGWRQASGMPEFSPFQSEMIVKVQWYRFSIVECHHFCLCKNYILPGQFCCNFYRTLLLKTKSWVYQKFAMKHTSMTHLSNANHVFSWEKVRPRLRLDRAWTLEALLVDRRHNLWESGERMLEPGETMQIPIFLVWW